MNNTKPSKPRLELTAILRNGREEWLGSFADGPRGRKDAAEALQTSNDQDAFLSGSIEHDRGNRYQSGDDEHEYAGHLTREVKIERVFADGQAQRLVRLPWQDRGAYGYDDYPMTLHEAEVLEAKRTRAMLWEDRGDRYPDRYTVSSPALTPMEERASNAQTPAEKSALLDQANRVLDKDRADRQTAQFERDTAAVLADNFNPNATPEANLVQSDAEAPPRRQRMRL